LAGLALLGWDELDDGDADVASLSAAVAAANWLASIQQRDGSVGISALQPDPKWPTSLAVLLWMAMRRAMTSQSASNQASPYDRPLDNAVTWTLSARGSAGSRKAHIGHDTTLVGWSWAADTHSWLEPTAMFVLALKAAGLADHPRAREGVRLLVDRLLPNGGANYGNTIVLGQPLLPHIQPTGLALLALAGESCADPRIEQSLAYLERELTHDTPAASLGYAVLGLTSHGRRPPEADEWLCAAFQREMRRGPSPYKLALIALAATQISTIWTTAI
jgi:hypothetical protein